MNRTSIEWIVNPDGSRPGWSWNPVTGCLNGCEYCYARRLAHGRLNNLYLANSQVAAEPMSGKWAQAINDPFYPRFWEDRLDELDSTTKRKHFTVGGASKVQPKGIFVCDMSDLFGIGIPETWTSRVLEVIKWNPHHRFYLLTKQPQNLVKFSPFPDNCWVGVTATNNQAYREAIVALAHIEAKVKYLSFEPLLENIKVRAFNSFINWVIIGAQTKPTVYPKIEWVEEIVRACDKAGVKVFLKDNLRPIIPMRQKPFWYVAHNESHLRQEMPDA